MNKINIESDRFLVPYEYKDKADKRIIILKTLKNIFINNNKFNKEKDHDEYVELKNIIIKIEKSIFNYSLKVASENDIYFSWDNNTFIHVYSSIASKIMKNIDRNSEVNKNLEDNEQKDDLIEKIIKKKIDLSNIAFMESNELNPYASKEIYDNIESRNNSKIEKKVCTLYICKNCKHNESILYSEQTRALDEGATWFSKCIKCNTRQRI